MGTSSSTLEIGNALNTLSQRAVPLTDVAVWKEIFVANVGVHDMFLAITPELIRKLRRDFPSNLAALFFKCVEQIHGFVESGASKANSHKGPSPTCCSNALLILTRIMPFIYEKKDVDEMGNLVPANARKGKAHGRQDFARKVLWENSLCDDQGTKFPLSGPVGKMLVQTLVAACFVPGYSIGYNQQTTSECLERFPGVEYNMLWASGIGSNNAVNLGFTETILANRLVLVKCFLSVLSEDCFEGRAVPRLPMRAVLVDETMCPHAATFVASLLNTMTSYTPQGSMPYTSHWVGNQEELTLKVSQLLCIVFDSMNADVVPPPQSPPSSRSNRRAENDEADEQATDDDNERSEAPAAASGGGQDGANENEDVEAAAVPEIENHAAWNILDRCQIPDFDGIFIGFFKLINNHVSSKSSQLPGSQRALAFMEEFIIILFKMLTKSSAFLQHFVASRKCVSFLIPMIDFAWEAIEDAAALSNIQIVVYMLMKLSACRGFVLNGNHVMPKTYMPFASKLAGGYVQGTYNDLVITAMASLMSCRKPWLVSLCEPAATVISNVSAFATRIDPPTASKLIDIMVHFCKPQVLELAGRPGAVILAAIVETLANLVQYQFNGCSTLVVNILRCEKPIRELHDGLRSGEIRLPADIAKRLHLYTIICVIDTLMPQITERLAREPTVDVHQFVKTTTLVGALPVPHNIMVRQFLPRPQTETWVLAWMWGCIFMHANPQFLDSRTVELFEMRAVSSEVATAANSGGAAGGAAGQQVPNKAPPQSGPSPIAAPPAGAPTATGAEKYREPIEMDHKA